MTKSETPKYLTVKNNKWILRHPGTGKRKGIKLDYTGTVKNRKQAELMRDDILKSWYKVSISKDKNQAIKDYGIVLAESNTELNNINMCAGEDMRLSVATQRCYDEQWCDNETGGESLRLMGKMITKLGDPFLTDITAEQVMTIRKEMDKKSAIATVNRHFGALKTILMKAQREWQILPYVVYIPVKQEPKGRIRYIKPDEELKIYQLLRDRKSFGDRKNIYPAHIDLFMYLMDTGSRVHSEAFVQPLKNIDFNTRKIHIYASKTDSHRTVPMTPRIYDICCRRKDNTYLFEDLTYTSVSEYVWKYLREEMDCSREDDPEFVPHAMRHTFCSNLWNDGVDVQLIMSYMGHEKIETTLRYAHLDESKAESFAIEKMNARSQLIMDEFNVSA